MDRLNALSTNEINKLNKCDLLALVKTIRRDSDSSQHGASDSVPSQPDYPDDVTPVTCSSTPGHVTNDSLKTILGESLEKLRSEIRADIKDEVSALRDIIDRQASEISSLKSAIKEQQHNILSLQRKDIANNVIVTGLPENKDEDNTSLKDKICDVLKSLDDSFESCSALSKVYRIGRGATNAGKARPVKVIFKDNASQSLVVRRARNLRGDSKFNGIYINPERTQADRSEDLRLRACARKLRGENPNSAVILKNGKLSMNGTVVETADPISLLFRSQ